MAFRELQEKSVLHLNGSQLQPNAIPTVIMNKKRKILALVMKMKINNMMMMDDDDDDDDGGDGDG